MDMCTIFTVALGNKVFFGNNEDNQRLPEETFVAFVPKQEIPQSWSTPGANGSIMIHGFMLVGVREGNRLFPQGGINDQGLCYDINGLPSVSFRGQKGIPWKTWFNSFDILWHCSTARDVEKWFLTHECTFPVWDGGQFHIADAKGDAVVMGIDEHGRYAFSWKGKNDFLVSTNFNLVNKENRWGNLPCPRFDTATKMLNDTKSEDEITVETCARILDAVHIDYRNNNGTVYSNIYDLRRMRVYIYHLHDFTRAVEFDLSSELLKMESNATSKDFNMVGSHLFSKFKGVRIHLIHELF